MVSEVMLFVTVLGEGWVVLGVVTIKSVQVASDYQLEMDIGRGAISVWSREVPRGNRCGKCL